MIVSDTRIKEMTKCLKPMKNVICLVSQIIKRVISVYFITHAVDKSRLGSQCRDVRARGPLTNRHDNLQPLRN